MLLKGGAELLNHPDVLNFYDELLQSYSPPTEKKIALFLPCSAKKPYSASKTHSKIKNIIQRLEFNHQKSIHELIVSEPLGIVPREWEEKYPAAHYDMVLDSWFPTYNIPKIRKKCGNNIIRIRDSSHPSIVPKNKIIKILSERVARFLIKTEDNYVHRIGFVRSSHREILEKASYISNIEIDFVFDTSFVMDVIENKGTFYWIMNGMRCQESLDRLFNKLCTT